MLVGPTTAMSSLRLGGVCGELVVVVGENGGEIEKKHRMER